MVDGAEVVKVSDRTAGLIGALESLVRKKILVGIPESENMKGVLPGEIGLAARAYINNNGAPEANIPQREFMRSGIKLRQKPIVTAMARAAIAAIDLDPTKRDVQKWLDRAGTEAVSGMRLAIRDGDFDPLAAATLRKRRQRGNQSDKPLLDTQAMSKGISYVIQEAGVNQNAHA